MILSILAGGYFVKMPATYSPLAQYITVSDFAKISKENYNISGKQCIIDALRIGEDVKYKKMTGFWLYIEYRHIFRGGHRRRSGSSRGMRSSGVKKQIIHDWKRCYREERIPDWNRGDS
jgi:hypothetical protein